MEHQTVKLEFTAPCNSAARFLGEFEEMLVSGSDAKTWNAHRTYSISAKEYEVSRLDEYWNDWKAEISERVSQHNQWVAEHRARIDQQVRQILGPKKSLVSSIYEDAQTLNISLSPLPTAVTIPIQPKTLHLTQVEARAGAGEPTFKIADDIADQLVETLRSFAVALGRQHKVSARMLQEGEESLRDMLLFILNAQWQGQVTGETFVGSGKTDLLFRFKNLDAFIGECKIWTGSALFSEAIDQLLGYTVWNDTRAGLILFIRDRKDVQGVIGKARACITGHNNYVRAGSSEDEFVVHSKHDSKRHIRLSLIPIHIPEDPTPSPVPEDAAVTTNVP